MWEAILPNYPIFYKEILGNSLGSWIQAGVIFLLVLGGLKLFQTVIISRLKAVFEKTKNDIDDIVINAIDSIYWPFYVFASLYIALQFLSVPGIVGRWAYYVFMAAVVYYAIKFVTRLIDYGAGFIIAEKDSGQDAGIVKVLSVVAKVVLWSGALVLVLANMGYNVTSLITGLGIGGIAVGLALQNILGDLFSSLVIYFDKPFRPGDFIIVGSDMGTVKKVGIKTTRIQALQGEEIVMSNSDLTGSRVQNFGKMERRRVVFSIGVTYNTPAAKLEKIPAMVRQAVTAQPRTEVDRVHFKEFGDSAMIYEIVYFVDSPEMSDYLDIQQAVNLSLVKQFEAERIEFAFPTRTVYVKKD